jgi:hypothetical protein
MKITNNILIQESKYIFCFFDGRFLIDVTLCLQDDDIFRPLILDNFDDYSGPSNNHCSSNEDKEAEKRELGLFWLTSVQSILHHHRHVYLALHLPLLHHLSKEIEVSWSCPHLSCWVSPALCGSFKRMSNSPLSAPPPFSVMFSAKFRDLLMNNYNLYMLMLARTQHNLSIYIYRCII